MSLIRPLPGGPGPPLNFTNRSSVPYGQTIHTMQTSGFHRWGFLILRTATYSEENNDLWEPFLARLRSDAEDTMTRKPPGLPRDEATPALMLPLLRWDVLEDREALAGADVEAARGWFAAWRGGVSPGRDGEGADHFLVRLARVARYRYFVMIDDESLGSLREEARVGASPDRPRNLPPVKVRVVDAGPPDDEGLVIAHRGGENAVGDEGDEEESPDSSESEEGSTASDPDWMWVEARFLLGFYNILQSDSGWEHFYVPPPRVYGRP